MKNSPSVLQMILATLLGVFIGLLAMQGLKALKKPDATSLPSQAKLEKPVVKAPVSLANFHLWPRLENRMNVLLMGVDSNGRDTERFNGCRSDTMIVASLDPESKKVALVSIPRDSRVRIADGHGVEKINAAHALGGPELSVKTVSEDFGIPIDHYIVIDVQGLKKVFEALGPVEVMVEKPMKYRDRAAQLNIALEPGVVKMDAKQLEEYVRFRHDPRGDIGRIERQQWFLRQVKKKLEEPEVLLKLPELFKLANEYVRTDLDVQDMFKIASFCKDLKPKQIATATLPGEGVTISGGSYWVPDPTTSSMILHRLTGAPLSISLISNNTGASIRSQRIIGDIPEAQAQTSEVAYSQENEPYRNLGDSPISVVIRYPRGHEDIAKNLEARLIEKGYNVKYRQRAELSECAHEEVIQTSYRANDELTEKMKEAISELDGYAVILNLDLRTSTDFVIIVSPTSVVPAPIPVVKEGEVPEAKSIPTKENGA